MAYTIVASVFSGLPGAVRLGITGPADASCTLVRQDGAREAHPVRNWEQVPSSGVGAVIDCEAPLGRPVTYSLLSPTGAVLATSKAVTCPPPADNLGVLRSVLRPRVSWMLVEPQDVSGTEWDTSSTAHRIVGSDTPVVVGEIRQRRTETVTLLCRSVDDADRVVTIAGDGTLLLLRVPPCAGRQTRDLYGYPMQITERRWGRAGWRLVSIDVVTTKWIGGKTEEPEFEWTFGDLRDSAPDFQTLSGRYLNFAAMSMAVQKPEAVRYER